MFGEGPYSYWRPLSVKRFLTVKAFNNEKASVAFFRHREISLAPPPLTRHSAFASHDIVSIFWLGRSCHCRTWHVNHFFSIATVATGQNVLMNSYRVKIYIYFQSVLFIPILDIYLFQLPTLETDKLKYRTLQTILLETRANAIWIREYKCWSRVHKRAVFLCWEGSLCDGGSVADTSLGTQRCRHSAE